MCQGKLNIVIFTIFFKTFLVLLDYENDILRLRIKIYSMLYVNRDE